MSKVTLVNISNVGGNPAAAALAINENFARIAAAFENCLFLDGTGPNQMEADLDLNGNTLTGVVLGPDVTIVEAEA